MKMLIVVLISGMLSLGASMYSLGYNDGKFENPELGRNTSIEIQYLKILNENTDTNTRNENLYLTYLESLYGITKTTNTRRD